MNPLNGYKEMMLTLSCNTIEDVLASEDNATVSFAGICLRVMEKQTKNGSHMALAVIEDQDSEITIVLFPKIYSRCKKYLFPKVRLIVTGIVDRIEAKQMRIYVLADSVLPLIKIAN